MAKETFERSKPHVNVGTIGHVHVVSDTSGLLTFDDDGSQTVGNDAPSSVVSFEAPMPSTVEFASIAFPIDDEWVFDPNSSGAAESIDFQLDVLPDNVLGTPEIEVTLAIVQGESFIATAAGAPTFDGSETDWTTLFQRNLRASDFEAADGGPERPDFSLPFQFGYAFSAEYSTALDVDMYLDNMTVEITTIPEPTSWALAMSLGAALLWNRWFRSDE